MGSNHQGDRLLWGLVERFQIMGCDMRGDGDSVYLTRYRFPRLGIFRPVLHVFHRSDHDEMHDHPWPFMSIILWRGYIEETPTPSGWLIQWAMKSEGMKAVEGARFRRRFYPGAILFRRPEHIHRVVLVNGKKAVTLVVMGKRCRDWGFWTSRRWQNFKSYFKEQGC